MVALLIVPMIGAMSLATEASNWFFTARSMQNAADSAALVAAQNGDSTTVTSGANTYARYKWEALSVLSQYGVNASSDTTLSVLNNQTCPDGVTTTCYKVTISKKLPIYLTRIVGYSGDTTLSAGGAGKLVSVSAMASQAKVSNTYCLLSLAAGGPNVVGIGTNGSPKADMTGCKIATNGIAQCNGHNLKADVSSAAGGTNNCDNTGGGLINQPIISDPYSALAANVPVNTCSPAGNKATYPQTTASNVLPANLTLPALTIYCGNVNVTGNTNITSAAGGSVMVIENGSLNISSGSTLKSLAGSGVTIIFSSPKDVSGKPLVIASLSPTYTLTGSGTLDIAAPTSGTWSGIAVYQDPSLTTGIDWSSAGNSPTWNVTGLFYLSKAAVSFSGIVNKASNGLDCFALVDDTFSSNGTSSILEHQSQCASAGLPPPSGQTIRQALVQ